jgi:AcrR family transcriptional regulator
MLIVAGTLISERGVNGFSMGSIARLSGVSKATIYKHWPDKEAVWLETARRLAGVIPSIDFGHPREDLTALLHHLARRENGLAWSRIWPRLVAYCLNNPEFGRKLKRYRVEPPRRRLKHILASAAEQGELIPDLDADFSLRLLAGPIFHCTILKSDVSRQLVEQVVNTFWRAHKAN